MLSKNCIVYQSLNILVCKCSCHSFMVFKYLLFLFSVVFISSTVYFCLLKNHTEFIIQTLFWNNHFHFVDQVTNHSFLSSTTCDNFWKLKSTLKTHQWAHHTIHQGRHSPLLHQFMPHAAPSALTSINSQFLLGPKCHLICALCLCTDFTFLHGYPIVKSFNSSSSLPPDEAFLAC